MKLPTEVQFCKTNFAIMQLRQDFDALFLAQNKFAPSR